MRYSVHPSIAYAHAILGNLPEKTGRSLSEWLVLLEKEGPANEFERRDWLKKEHCIGSTTAWIIAERSVGKSLTETDGDAYLAEIPAFVEGMFRGKEHFRPAYEAILSLVETHFPEAKICPCATIVPLYRKHVFAQIKPATKTRLELGLCLKNFNGALSPRLVDTGGLKKGDRITHRFELAPCGLPDEEMLHWLRVAYDLDH